MAKASNLSADLLAQISEAIRTIRFGKVEITIHDSRIVQIEKAERIRVDRGADLATGGVSDTVGRTDRTTGGSPHGL